MFGEVKITFGFFLYQGKFFNPTLISALYSSVKLTTLNILIFSFKLVSPGPRLSKSTVVNLTYRFHVPIGYNTSNDVYSWIFKEWTACSVPCNGGIR